jgi:capsular polysaccharide biosynthesis protein
VELRAYWRIISRRWPVVVGLTLLALVFSATTLTLAQPVQSFQAVVRLAVRPEPSPSWSLAGYGEYYKYVASEYLNDDIVEIIQSPSFMQSIQASLAQHPDGPPSGSIKAWKAHRVIILAVDSGRESDARRIAEAVSEHIVPYFDILTEQNPVITIIDPPTVTAFGGGRQGALDVALRTLLGLFAGLALVFLLDYLDDTVRNGAEASRLTGLPVLGELPNERGVRRRAKGSRQGHQVGSAAPTAG